MFFRWPFSEIGRYIVLWSVEFDVLLGGTFYVSLMVVSDVVGFMCYTAEDGERVVMVHGKCRRQPMIGLDE